MKGENRRAGTGGENIRLVGQFSGVRMAFSALWAEIIDFVRMIVDAWYGEPISGVRMAFRALWAEIIDFEIIRSVRVYVRMIVDAWYGEAISGVRMAFRVGD